MQRNVMEYLEQIVPIVPNKTAYADENTELTFREVYDQARAIGSFLQKMGCNKEPVVIFMGRHPQTIVAFYGVIYSGCYYVPLDEEMPRQRMELIFQKLSPKVVIYDKATESRLDSLPFEGTRLRYDEIIKEPILEDMLAQIREHQIDTDPIYIVYTSGSTGEPKGVVACHRSVIDYVDQLSEVLEVNSTTVFGNQTPLFVDACLKELYPTLKYGAMAYLIPKSKFLFPMELIAFLSEHKINTICWVVSALTMISAFGALEKEVPNCLHTIVFGSEVFPMKQFLIWKKYLPQARFINLYGPTEATGMSCYYEVDRDFEPSEVLPIGRPFRNTEILLLDENNQSPPRGAAGEICIRGTALTLGYYGNFDKTKEVFVQNPLNHAYPELIYRTGDLGKYNDRGELLFLSRRDNQIKHMGHRIELGEIEAAAGSMNEIESVCVIFDEKQKKLVLYYVGVVAKEQIIHSLKEKLPRYMLPNQIEALERMPLTVNGKIDRMRLKKDTQSFHKELL